jgi:hypothetical protein
MNNDRVLTVLAAMIIGLALLTLICFITLFLAPNLPFNPLSPARATVIAATRQAAIPIETPTFTPPPTYPPTWTPSPTLTPGPTRTTTDTRTPTPTDTSTPTDTPTFTPTSTPLPPTDTPTVTPTPTDFPFFVVSHSSMNNCFDLGIWGMVTAADGLPLGGIDVQYGEFGVPDSRFIVTTDNNGRFDAQLIPASNRSAASESHTWYAFIVEDGLQQSPTFTFATDPIFADQPETCEEDNGNGNDNGNANANDNGNANANDNGNANANDNANANGNDNTAPGCLADPCTSENSVQIKIIDWQQSFNISETQAAVAPMEFEDVNCSQFSTQAEAQTFYEENAGPTLDVYGLDPDRDGLACEELP